MSFTFKHGEYVVDLITGLKGIVIGRSDFLTGCNQYLIQPPGLQEGKIAEPCWFDEHRIDRDPEKIGQRQTLSRAADQPPG